MAKPEHVEIVRRGADAVAEWRREHPRERLDLCAADLREVHLRNADLHWADASGAALIGADLRGADLRWAHVRAARIGGANLKRASLMGADFTDADLTAARLREADLSDANLRRAELAMAALSRGNLTRASLRNSRLSRADLTFADLSAADLRSSHLFGTDLHGAILSETNLSRSSCGFTSLTGCDLSRTRRLQHVFHQQPSSVGVDTLVLTLEGANGAFTAAQRTFFINAGVPKPLLEHLPGLLQAQPIHFFSCFISHGADDAEFAQRVYRDLRRRKIRCWKYDVDAIVGREVWGNISRAIVLHEKMIVICSESSLERPGVHGEIERALQKEEQLKREKAAKGDTDMDTDVLVPVRLDDYALEKWDHPRAADVRKKHIGDFSGWQDAAKYKEAFEQLLRALDPRSKLGLSKDDLRQLGQG